MALGLYPVNLTSELGQVRVNIGDLDATLDVATPAQSDGFIISDDLINFSLTKYADKDSATRIYLATVDVLRYIVASLAKQIRYRERAGGSEIEGHFHIQFQNYKDLLDQWTKDPTFNPSVGAGFVINTTKPIISMGMFDDMGG